MATNFAYYKYQSDAGSIYSIRASSAVAAVTGNTPPTGNITDKHVDVTVSNHGNRRKSGIFARGVKLRRQTGTAPNVVNHNTFIPIFTPAALTTIGALATIDYNGQTWEVVDTISEA